MQQYLITTDEVSALSRGMSVHLDPDKIETYIRESENIYIKSALGDELFLDVKTNPDKYALLLDGGTYETKCKEKKLFTGLRIAWHTIPMPVLSKMEMGMYPVSAS